MRKSRLNLFKSTSLLISVLGIIMIVIIICVVGYMAFSAVSSSITTGISSGPQYDELAALNSSYNALEKNFTSIKSHYEKNANSMSKYDQALMELTRARQAIDSVDSALNSGQSPADVDERIEVAKEKLDLAQQAYQSLL